MRMLLDDSDQNLGIGFDQYFHEVEHPGEIVPLGPICFQGPEEEESDFDYGPWGPYEPE